MRKMIEATAKCPYCKLRIGFLNFYNEETGEGKCPSCAKIVREAQSSFKPRLIESSRNR